MSRRLGVLAIVILLLFAAAVAQSVNIQFFRASALNDSPLNPRVQTASVQFARGEITAADGTILARSVAQRTGPYPWRRIYPMGALTSGLVGFSSPALGSDWGLEAQYASTLSAHTQPAQSLEQVLAPTSAADSITLTLETSLQRVAQKALGGQDGAAVVLDPRTGAVLAMYSNPTYNPQPLTSPSHSVAWSAWKTVNTNDPYGFPPLGLVATQQTFPPGSTFKVVTTAAVVTRKPSLFTKTYKSGTYTTLPDSNLKLYNDGGSLCGGTLAVMLPESCDPGYALVGLDVGATDMTATANSFGYNKIPPFDFPNVVPSVFPSAASFQYNLAGLMYSSIGQENVRSTALQNVLVAAAVADGGVIMTPHLLNYISGPDGSIVKRYQPTQWLQPMTAAQAQQIVPLMQGVVQHGTAYGIFPSNLDVAAKTGTAQTFFHLAPRTDDWMIAFAPATNPTVAVAVVMPFQAVSAYGATVAGPIVKCLIEGALALQSGQPVSGTSTTCPS